MSIRPPRARYVWLAALLVTAACSDDGPRTADDAAANGGTGLAILPTRDGPRRETTGGVPHIQLNAERAPEVDEELRRRVFLLPGVEERDSQLSLPGARSLWLADDLELATFD
jgi:hypothetical protein